MAKMFYTLEEAKSALGRSEDDIKQFAREGRLREFRDGPRLMFKADQVEQLRAEIAAGGDQVDLGVSDSGGMIDLVDTTGASGTSITLADTNAGQGTAFALKSGSGAGLKEETALAADLGLSGTAGGIPSPAAGGTRMGSGVSSGGSRAGINVFGADEIGSGIVDPMAQTSITPSAQEINLESVGSGSGLLDLSRERDDTSLGAVLNDIPSDSRAGSGLSGISAETGIGAGIDLDDPRGGIDRAPLSPVTVTAYDPMAPAFGAAAFAASIVALFGLFALVSGVLGTSPDLLKKISSNALPAVAGGGAVLVLIFFIGGWLVGRVKS